MSTDGGTGTARGAHTLSFDRNGRPIPAEHRPKRVFDMLFVKSDADAAKRLALSQSALDDLLADAAEIGSEFHEDLRGDALTLADESEQDVLGADVVVSELERLAEGQLEHLLGPGGERDVTRRGGSTLADDLLHL